VHEQQCQRRGEPGAADRQRLAVAFQDEGAQVS